jgi:translation initiation factor 5A
LIDVTEEGYLSLMDDSGDVRDDLHCNHDPALLEEIKSKFDAGDEMMICILKAMGKEQPVAIKAIASK